MGKKMLIVDDDPQMQELMRQHLRGQGHEVMIADSGRMALKLLHENKDTVLMLLDVHLSDIDGLEILRIVKEILPNLPVIMVSSMTDVLRAKQLMCEGAQDYITKPVDFDYLDESIWTHLL